MKPRTLMALFIICFAVSIFVSSCATTHNPDKMVFERFCGTWANTAYEEGPTLTRPFAKIIYNPDGTCLRYTDMDYAGPAIFGYYTVEKRWTDSEGNSWYLIERNMTQTQRTFYDLSKLDKSNSVLEIQSSNIDYPTEINPKDWHSQYRIYFRY
jgi:hypothetical protein